jgi:hypothetical protein
VTFTVSGVVGSVTSGTVSNGNASVSFTLPGGTGAGTYTITATYNAGGNFATSSDNTHTLTVSGAATTTTASNAIATFSASNQNVTLSATVTSLAGTVNAGTVTFKVFQGVTQVGSSAMSGTVSSGNASATYVLPGGAAVAVYTITATYNAGGNFATSSDTTHTLAVVLNVSGQVSVTQTGFAVNRATGLWTSTLTVHNTSAAPISGPIEVLLTNLSSNATMTNETGVVGVNPYILVSAGTLAPGASVSVAIQFKNPSDGSITFTPVAYSGAF